MAHSESHTLFHLIQSMTRSEKRFFKVHLRTHSSKHTEGYKALFDAISKQSSYDEQSLQVEFRKAGQRFPVMKHRLMEKVLDALEVFERGKDDVLELRTELNRAQVLLKRGFSSQAQSHLNKVLEGADRLGLPELALEAHRLRITYLDPDLTGGSDSGDSLADWDEKMLGLLDTISEEWAHTRRRAELFRLINESNRSKAIEISEELMGLQSQINSASPRSRFFWHHSMAGLGFLTNNSADCLEHITACTDVLDEHEYLTKDHKLSLAKMYANGFYSAYSAHEGDKAEAFLVKLKVAFKEESKSANGHEYLALYLQSKLFLENHGHTYYDAEHVQSLEEIFLDEQYKLNTMVRAGLDYGLALFYHGIGDSSRALRSLNRILHAPDIQRDDEVYARALIYSNILHIDNGDKEWLLHSVRTLKRYLQSRDRLGRTENSLIRYIADIRRSKTPEGEVKALERYIVSLREVRRDPLERVSFEYFDFLRWAEEKLSLCRRNFGLVA